MIQGRLHEFIGGINLAEELLEISKKAEEILKEVQNLPGSEGLNKLRDYRKDLITEVRDIEKSRNKLRNDRDNKNQNVKELFSKAKEAREKRDAINEDVKLNKALRDLRKEDADKAFGELEKIEDSMKEKGISPKDFGKRVKLSKQIRDLEMKIQTTGNLKPQEERELIERIEKLSLKLDEVEVADEVRDALRKNRKTLRQLRGEALSHHKEVQKLAIISQNHHDEMIASIKEARTIRGEADSHHQEIIKISKEITDLRKEINRISAEADRIRKELGQETAAERKKRKAEEAAKEEEELETKAEDVLERYQSGEKLGFEEFKLLISRGLLTDND